MKQNKLLNLLVRAAGALVCLALLIGAAQPLEGQAAPNPPKGASVIPFLLLPTDLEICTGVMTTFQVHVIAAVVPVPNAQLNIDGTKVKTGPTGVYQWYQKYDQEGDKTLTITASKEGYKTYTSKYTLKITKCAWKIGLTYNEEYMDGSFWVWYGDVESDYYGISVDQTGTLHLDGNKTSIDAQYKANLFDLINPIVCDTTPPVSGSYPIRFNGTFKDGQLKINLSANPIKLPQTVKVHCYSTDNMHLDVKPFPYPLYPTVDLVGAGKVTSLKFGKNGGTRPIKFNRMMFWAISEVSSASGVVVVTRVKK